MSKAKENVSVSGLIIFILIMINAVVLKIGFITNEKGYWALVATLPLLLLAIFDVHQKKNEILRNYPVIGRLRYFFDHIRPEVKQYFFGTDLYRKPFNRRQRSNVRQKAKNEKETVAFVKEVLVADFHTKTLMAPQEMMVVCGFKSIEDVRASKFLRRIDEQNVRSFEQIYFKTSNQFKNNYQCLN